MKQRLENALMVYVQQLANRHNHELDAELDDSNPKEPRVTVTSPQLGLLWVGKARHLGGNVAEIQHSTKATSPRRIYFDMRIV